MDAVARVCATPPKTTVLVPATKTEPVPFQAVALVAFSFKVLEPPFKVPAVKVTTPLKVCVRLAPRFNVPPDPLMVNPAPFTLPVKVVVPAVLVNETVPVVVNPVMLWADVVPAIVIPPDPLVKVPALVKLP